MPARMDLRLHRGGKFRRWLGARLGGDFELGDRVWRRALHVIGAATLLYYVLPTNFFIVAPKEYVLLAALAAVLVVEGLRHAVGLELPTIRPYETGRVGSFAIFGTAIVIAILVFPLPIACAVVLGTAIVDPLAGELRGNPRYRRVDAVLPFGVYAVLAFFGLAVLGRWPGTPLGRPRPARRRDRGRRGAPEGLVVRRRLRDDPRARARTLRGRGPRVRLPALGGAYTIGVRVAWGAPFSGSGLIA